jgi:NAD(P)-dependent dehydrogenase (short-subunit alcohol dehydrogenase family)
VKAKPSAARIGPAARHEAGDASVRQAADPTRSTFRPMLFAGRVAMITGAAGGIGLGAAMAFRALGAAVIVHDIDAGKLRGLPAAMAGRGPAVFKIDGDLSRPGVADDVFDRALRAAGRIDFLVNNAGRSWSVGTEDIGEPRSQELLELNLKSVLSLSRQLIMHARQRSGGASIVQISSTAGIAGYERRAVYCATKFGVIGLTKALALEHAREGIRVNAVLPHVVETEMFRTTASPAEAAVWRAGIPIGRFARVEDVAALIIFLCSDAAAYLTGGVYPVDGGATAGPYGGEQ